jgi:hypothetical protein
MSNLEMKRLEMQVKKADAVVAELEYKIQERLDDIQRMKDHIQLQLNLKDESLKTLANMREKE